LKRSRASWLAVSTVSGDARIAKTDVSLHGVRHRCSAAQATDESDDRVVGNLPSIALLELAPRGIVDSTTRAGANGDRTGATFSMLMIRRCAGSFRASAEGR
jgi:hypothetical protein